MGAVLCCIAAAGGFAAALVFVGKDDSAPSAEKSDDSATAILNLGQFTIPIFDEDRVQGVLLAQINIETNSLTDMQSLSRNKARIRSHVIDSFFAMESEGVIAPGALKASKVASRLQKDLALTYGSDAIRSVLIDRLLIQENGRAAQTP